MLDSVTDLSALLECAPSFFNDLRVALRKAEFDERALREGESIAPGALDLVRLPLVHEHLKHQTDAASAASLLFIYGGALSESSAQKVLGSGLLERALTLGLVHRDGDEIRAGLRIMPFEGLYVLSDELWQDGDPVMGPGVTTLQLAKTMPVDLKGQRVMDVGTGAGSLALVAKSRGASEVLATDLSVRATELTRLNAQLNDLELEVADGDLTAPASGRRFDCIVAQPPFITSPQDVESKTALHGGPSGEELTLRLFSELEQVLAEDKGRALILFDAPTDKKSPLAQRVTAALSKTTQARLSTLLCIGTDANPTSLALHTAAGTHRMADERFGSDSAGYLRHMNQLGIERVVHAIADIRRPQGPPFTAAVQLTSLHRLDAMWLDRLFAGTLSASANDKALLTLNLEPPPGAELRVKRVLTEGTDSLHLHTPASPIVDYQLGENAFSVVETLRTSPTVAAGISELVGGGDIQPVLPTVLALVRELLLAGVLAPVEA